MSWDPSGRVDDQPSGGQDEDELDEGEPERSLLSVDDWRKSACDTVDTESVRK